MQLVGFKGPAGFFGQIMGVFTWVGVNHLRGLGLGFKISCQSRSIHLVASSLATGGVTLDDDAEPLFLRHADPGLVEGTGRQFAPPYGLQPLRHRSEISDFDLVLSKKALQHLQYGEVGTVENCYRNLGVSQLLSSTMLLSGLVTMANLDMAAPSATILAGRWSEPSPSTARFITPHSHNRNWSMPPLL